MDQNKPKVNCSWTPEQVIFLLIAMQNYRLFWIPHCSKKFKRYQKAINAARCRLEALVKRPWIDIQHKLANLRSDFKRKGDTWNYYHQMKRSITVDGELIDLFGHLNSNEMHIKLIHQIIKVKQNTEANRAEDVYIIDSDEDVIVIDESDTEPYTQIIKQEFDASSDTQTLSEIPSTADHNEHITNRNCENRQLSNGNITDKPLTMLPRILSVNGSVNGNEIGSKQHDNVDSISQHWCSDTLKSIEKRLLEIERKSGRNAAMSVSLELLNMAMLWEDN